MSIILRPIWPTMATDDPPTNEEIVAHNLACIADRLENLTGYLERISEHLYDIKTGRRAR